jgi:FtsH ternary system domain X1
MTAEITAETTARRVLAWAVEPSGPLPDGPLWETSRLARPEAATVTLAGQLAQATAARLGTGAPPFGDENPIGAGVVLLAAAVGGRKQPDAARRMAEALPAARPVRSRPAAACWSDVVARHGLVAAALEAIPVPAPGGTRPGAGGGEAGGDQREEDATCADHEPLTETLLRMSPLTAVLHRPALRLLDADTTGNEVETAAALAGRPRGPAVLTAALACWSPQPAVLNWRVELLERLGRDHPDLILDTYTLARLRHGDDWDLRLRWAERTLGLPGPSDPLAIATARFWVPLARLRQRNPAMPDARPLLSGYRFALDLVRRLRLVTAGAA